MVTQIGTQVRKQVLWKLKTEGKWEPENGAHARTQNETQMGTRNGT